MSVADAANRPKRQGGWLELSAVAALGALQTLAFVHTALWPLQFAAVAVLARRAAASRPRRAAAIGFVFGSAWMVAGVWWLFISMHRYGGLPAWMAALAVLALAAALSSYLAAAMAVFSARRRSRFPIGGAVLFAAVWLGAELCRGLLFTGFPWVASGYAQIDSPLAALAPWVGVYGLGCVMALLSALLGLGFRPFRPGAAGGFAAVVLAIAALGHVGRDGWTQPAGRIGVALLQTNVPQDEKFDPGRLPESMDRMAQTILAARAPIVVGPETAIPLLPSQISPGWLDDLTAPFRSGDRALLIGIPLGNDEQGYTNSVTGIARGQSADYRYDKHHLVPFGEFVPFGFRWFVDLMNIPLGDFNRGPLAAPSFAAAGQRIGPNICYEDLFGEELATRFRDPALAPTVFANLSNIGWFGDTIAIDQHLAISRMRSLELERPMLRSTNTGATAIVDHRGRVLRRLPAFTFGLLEGEVEGRSGLTPYAAWVSRYGLWPLAAVAALVVLVNLRPRAGRRRWSGRHQMRRGPMNRLDDRSIG